MSDEASVLVRREGRAGRILLNRPKALNALDLPMLRAIAAALEDWRDDPCVHLVLIEGAGGRAFCAGGDIRALRQNQLDGTPERNRLFFSEEYALNAQIAEYPKPFVSLIDGVCMGGGIGVSVHGAYRVASEHAMFAMPETAIALFPDIGASYLLPRLPGVLGMYLGLTGARVTGADAVHAGLATHFTPRAALPDLAAALARDGVAALAAFAAPLPGFTLAAQVPAITRCFSGDTLAAILAALEAETTGAQAEWARHTLETMAHLSPSSMSWTLRLLRDGAGRTLRQCLAAELALGVRVTAHPDFIEGVRAMVVDKDRNPRWQPARIDQVDAAAIATMFA
ncbi:MAG: enoyl-CoA hydratase/isomerase family protein [Rhodospirillales bacterium]|nr:enoyl-CoA hydratase/isomerase family protein [Rhodospirillales bacterium]